MCTNYTPPRREAVEAMVPLKRSTDEDWKDEIYQDYAAPLIRAGADGNFELITGSYGIVPKDHLPPDIKRLSTMNARAETIGELRSYKTAWRACHTCLLPTQVFYEPNYESGRAERWAIGMADEAPFCIAGIWRAWSEDDGSISHSFTQITINADQHPVMQRFQKPGEERRSVVIVPKSEYQDWLNCSDPEVARSMLNLYPADLMKTYPASKGYSDRPRTASLF
jgi:putative SOS response-associated peptidase YedK